MVFVGAELAHLNRASKLDAYGVVGKGGVVFVGVELARAKKNIIYRCDDVKSIHLAKRYFISMLGFISCSKVNGFEHR